MKMEKHRFRIGQLAERLGVEKFVIRFWEKEFCLNTHRSSGGQRFYEQKDLELFTKIKQLLYEGGYTIAGAKKQLKKENTYVTVQASRKTTLDTHKEIDQLQTQLELLQKQLIKLRDFL